MLIAILVRRKIAWQGQNKTGECEGQEKTQKYFFNEKKNILYDSQILSNPQYFINLNQRDHSERNVSS